MYYYWMDRGKDNASKNWSWSYRLPRNTASEAGKYSHYMINIRYKHAILIATIEADAGHCPRQIVSSHISKAHIISSLGLNAAQCIRGGLLALRNFYLFDPPKHDVRTFPSWLSSLRAHAVANLCQCLAKINFSAVASPSTVQHLSVQIRRLSLPRWADLIHMLPFGDGQSPSRN